MVRGISGMNAAIALAVLAGTGARIVPDIELGRRHQTPEPDSKPDQTETVVARPSRTPTQPTDGDLAAMEAASNKRARKQAKRTSLVKTEA